jgi:hypothetical protein
MQLLFGGGKLRSLGLNGLAACAILAAWLTPASADVIYIGGAPDQGGQIYSETPASAAMSFELTPGETDITGLEWWGGCYPATTCGAGTFQISIWSDDGGVPGTVLDYAPVGDGNQMGTGNLIGGSGGWDEYEYSAGFGAFTNLSADTTYFLVIQETEAEPSGTWGWETTSSAPAGAFLEGNDGTDGWTSLPETLAFELTGPPAGSVVPEPGSLPLFCTGIFLLIAVWQRSRRGRAHHEDPS